MQIHRSRSVRHPHHACGLRERIHLPPRDVHTTDGRDLRTKRGRKKEIE